MRPRAATAEEILDAADRVAFQFGIEGLTIRKLCAELGVTSPAVYRHFASKDDIREALIDRIVVRTELPGSEAGDWIDRLRIVYVSVHDAVAPYDGLASRLAQEIPDVGQTRWATYAYLVELLKSVGLSTVNRRRVMSTLYKYVWGDLLIYPSLEVGARTARADFLWGLDCLLEIFRQELGVPPNENEHRAGPRALST